MTAAAADPPPVRNFYLSVIDESELLAAAHELEGIDDEITMLRVRLKDRLADDPEHHHFMLQSVELIVRAVAARYRMSAKSKHDLTESAVNTLRLLADEVMPQRLEDV